MLLTSSVKYKSSFKSRKQVAEIDFLRAAWTFRRSSEWNRCSFSWKGVRGGWHGLGIRLGCRVCQGTYNWRPWVEPNTHCRDYVSHLVLGALWHPPGRVGGRGHGHGQPYPLFHTPQLDKWQKMDGFLASSN